MREENSTPHQPSPPIVADALGLNEPALIQRVRETLRSRPARLAFCFCVLLLVSALVFGVVRQPDSRKPQQRTASHAEEAEAHRARGWVFAQARLPGDALREFGAALRVYPQWVDPLFGRAAALYQLGRVDDAIAGYSEVIRLRPDLPEPYYWRALLLRDLGRLDEAIADFSSVIRISPRDQRPLLRRGGCYQVKGEMDAALRDFESLIKIGPENYDAYYQRARIFISQGDPQRGLREVDDALRQYPGSAKLFFGRALIHAELEELEEAVEDCAEAIRLDEHFGFAYALRAQLELAFGDFPAALSFAQLATQLVPALPVPFQVRGRVYDQQQQHGAALNQFKEATAREPEALEPLAWHALTRAHAGEHAAAREELERCVDRFSGIADAHLLYAWFLATCPEAAFRNGARAVQEAEIALELSRGHAAALDVLATAYAECGEFDRASVLEQKAIEKTPARASACMQREARLQEFRWHIAHRDFAEGF